MKIPKKTFGEGLASFILTCKFAKIEKNKPRVWEVRHTDNVGNSFYKFTPKLNIVDS